VRLLVEVFSVPRQMAQHLGGIVMQPDHGVHSKIIPMESPDYSWD
jgi:hypothetical protein